MMRLSDLCCSSTGLVPGTKLVQSSPYGLDEVDEGSDDDQKTGADWLLATWDPFCRGSELPVLLGGLSLVAVNCRLEAVWIY